MHAHFDPAAIKFLRALKKNNDREWFGARKDMYERQLKAPMLAIIGEVNEALMKFAPEFVRPAEKCMMRIYRDIRFSKNKNPYKTNVAAWWARQGLEKTSGGGFYFELNETSITIAAGVYMPEKEQLLAIRRMLLERHEDLRKLLNQKKLRAAFSPMDGNKMSRGPKGFPPDHPAMDLILHRQWGVARTLPVETALAAGLVKEIASRFALATPLIRLLNEPLMGRPKKALF